MSRTLRFVLLSALIVAAPACSDPVEAVDVDAGGGEPVDAGGGGRVDAGGGSPVDAGGGGRVDAGGPVDAGGGNNGFNCTTSTLTCAGSNHVVSYQSCVGTGTNTSCEYRASGKTYTCAAGCACATATDALLADACPAAMCTGTATSCSVRSSVTCDDGQGCHEDNRCTGTPSSCYYQSSSSACYAQDGCYWNTTSKSCSGSARSCSYYSGPSGCGSQRGCRWQYACAGVATSCSLLSTTTCGLQPGCAVTYP